jgi:hypothetical protein
MHPEIQHRSIKLINKKNPKRKGICPFLLFVSQPQFFSLPDRDQRVDAFLEKVGGVVQKLVHELGELDTERRSKRQMSLYI